MEVPKQDGNCFTRREVNILAKQISKCDYRDILQIGTHNGYTALSLIQNCRVNVITVDYIPEGCPSLKVTLKGKGHTVEQNNKNHNTLKSIKEEHRIDGLELHTCGSDEFFKNNKKMYDMIIIDGDHSYEQSKKDLENSLKFINKGGLIVIHDIRKNGRVQGLHYNDNCSRVFYEYVGEKKFVPCRNGLGLIWV